ncbi:WavQ protein [Rhodopirellula europaea]|uniref:WavQ protein n=1 Tax=Rhodopirellula europaea TaxID=1263866 RepID=UPI003D26905A
MKFYIASPEYNRNSGGTIALHNLCHLINTHFDTHQAMMVRHNADASYAGFIRDALHPRFLCRRFLGRYETNPEWDTPFAEVVGDSRDTIAIYPEIVLGNPTGCKNVARWFLHHPGFLNGKVHFGRGEIYFRHRDWVSSFQVNGSKTSKHLLKAYYFPSHIYNDPDNAIRDIECCHMIRKGRYTDRLHPTGSIELDGKSHEEIAAVFKRAKTFMCYDENTAYSRFAACCGCDSIVIPSKKQTPEEWLPSESDRFGIAYGTSEEQLAWARSTKGKMWEELNAEHENSLSAIRVCIAEMKEYFL